VRDYLFIFIFVMLLAGLVVFFGGCAPIVHNPICLFNCGDRNVTNQAPLFGTLPPPFTSTGTGKVK